VLSLALGGLVLTPAAASPALASTGVAVDDAASTPADEDLAIDVLGNDAGAPDDATLSVSGSSNNGAYIWVDDARLVHYQAFTPGTDSFDYEVLDGTGDPIGSATVTVTVSKAKVVSARDDDLQAERNTAGELSVLDNDTTGNGVLTMSVVTGEGPTHGTAVVDPNDGYPTLTYTPSTGYTGADALTYRITDSNGATDTGQVTLTVARVSVLNLDVARTWDGAHLAWDNPRSSAFNGQLAVRYAAADADGNVIAPSSPSEGTAVPVGWRSTRADLTGLSRDTTYAVSVFAGYRSDSLFGNDTWSEAASGTFTPGIAPVRRLHADGTDGVVTVVWTNPPGSDGTRVTYETATGAEKQLTLAAGVTTKTFTNRTNGQTYAYRVEAHGGDQYSDERYVEATPRATNKLPVATDDTVSLRGGRQVDFNVLQNDTDPNASDSLQLLDTTSPASGTIDCDDFGDCTFTPADDTAEDGPSTMTFSYTVGDGHNGRDTATVTLLKRSVTLADDDEQVTTAAEATFDVLDGVSGVLPTDTLRVDGATSKGGTVEVTTGGDDQPVLHFVPNGEVGVIHAGYGLLDEYGDPIAHATLTLEVKLAPRLSTLVAPEGAPVGAPVQVTGTAGPVDAGDTVRLERFTSGAWQTVGTTTFATGSPSTAPSDGAPYSFTLRESTTGYPGLRVVVPAQGGRAESTQEAGPLTVYKASLPSMRRTGDEYLTIKDPGRSEFNLRSWTLTTKAGKTLTLPTKVLVPGSSVRIHPGSGRTTRSDIYLRRGASFGNTHDRLRLRDGHGALVATKSY
jgi:hypothetical protein